MKKYSILFLSLLLLSYSDYVIGQTTISPTATSKLYYGLDNPITIAIAGCPCTLVTAKVSQGQLRETAPCKFVFTADTLGTVTFVVTEKGKENKPTSPFRFKIYRVPAKHATSHYNDGGAAKRK